MATPTFKSFVSEKEIEEVKRKRQEEWEKVRKPDQPLERPEEEYDPRTLYERLKEQKDKKQEEWEEQFKFKNMIYKGLDDEEAGFLTFVAKQQAELKAQVIRQEKEELSSFREAVAKVRDEAELATTQMLTSPDLVDDSLTSADHRSAVRLGENSPPAKSQMTLLAGLIKPKRKRSDSSLKKDGVASLVKKQKFSLSPKDSKNQDEDECEDWIESTSQGCTEKLTVAGKKQETPETSLGALSGLAAYSSSDSSDSES